MLIPCLLCASLLWAQPCPGGEPLPFRPGEKLRYKVSWTGIPVADAVLEILPMEKVGGADAWHFVMTVKTLPVVDAVYPVSDRMDSYADAGLTHALQYRERRETRRVKDVSVKFDWRAKTAHYTRPGRRLRKPVPLLDGAFDPLSIFYYFRTRKLQEGEIIERPVSDGKKCVPGRAAVRGLQTVTAGGRQYEAWLVEPELGQIGGVFEKSPGAKLQICVTADARRLPVLVKSEVAVGSFTAELVGITGNYHRTELQSRE